MTKYRFNHDEEERHMKKIKRILVTTDFSPLSASATEYAKMLAKVHQARLYLVHVVEWPIVVGDPTIAFSHVQVLPNVMENARQEMKRFASRNLRGLRNVEFRLMEGIAYDQIVRLATDEEIDLIVMATHGLTGLAHLLIGSVAERVVRHSPVPVFLVKPEEMRREGPLMHGHLIHLAEFDNELEAKVACGHLESAGIRAIVLKDDAGGMLPSLQETEGVSVCVLPEDMKKAKAILHEKSMVKRK
jgi:nucleotide-binding universal stress UspA family protein